MSAARAASSTGAPAPDDAGADSQPVVTASAPPTRSRTRAAVAWSYVLTVGRFTTTAVVTLVMAAFLDPRAYGVMALAMVWVVFAQSLAMHGPTQAVIQREDVTDRHFDAAFWVTLAGSVVMAAIFAGAAPLWARVNGAPELVPVCWALAPSIVLNSLVVVPDAILQRNLHFKRLSQRVLVAGLLSGAAGIAVAVAGYGVWALVVQQLTQTALSAVLVWIVVPWRPRRGPIRAAIRDIRGYSLHSVSGFFANFVATRSDALLMGAYFGPVAIGLYRFATRITNTVNEVAVGGLGQISLPHLARFKADREAFAAQLGRVIHAGSLVAFPAFGILAPSARPLLAWIGPQWADAAPSLVVLCVAGMIGSIGAISGAALQAAGRPGASAAIGWSVAAVTTVTLIMVGLRFSPAGARTQVLAIAVAYTVISAAACVAAIVLTFRWILHVPIGPAMMPSVPAALSAVAAGVIGWAVQPLTHGMVPVVALLITGVFASAAAAAVLLVLDAEVSGYARRFTRAVRARRA